MEADPIAWALSLAAIAVTLTLATKGWRRDATARTEQLKSECVAHLVDFIHAQLAPLLDDAWHPRSSMDATVHYVKAVGVMNAIDPEVRDCELTRWVAVQGQLLGNRSREYRRSGEAEADTLANTFGLNRSALLAASTELKQELLQWQRGDLRRTEFRSFAMHYSTALLDQYELARQNQAV